MNRVEALAQQIMDFGQGPLLEEMPRMGLEDKGIDGPTAAHRIEALHAPFNFAFLTCTTGTTAFQNLVGVTFPELPQRRSASMRTLSLLGIGSGDHIVISYPPLVSVFTKEGLSAAGVSFSFIQRPSRDALLLALCTRQPKAVIGESSFLQAAFRDAAHLGLLSCLPQSLVVVAAGSPLDPELEEAIHLLPGQAALHDLYGCQEFGWLLCDGIPLREDLVLWDCGRPDKRRHLIVGGLATGDTFLLGAHPCNPAGTVLTGTRMREPNEAVTTIQQVTASSPETAWRTARTILRIKGRIVRVSEQLCCGAAHTALNVSIPGQRETLSLQGPDRTAMFDTLLAAQMEYQQRAKADPVWNKQR